MWQVWSCGLVHCPGGNATVPILRVLASSDGISSWTLLKPQHSNPNPNPLANQTPWLPWISYATQKLMLSSSFLVTSKALKLDFDLVISVERSWFSDCKFWSCSRNSSSSCVWENLWTLSLSDQLAVLLLSAISFVLRSTRHSKSWKEEDFNKFGKWWDQAEE